MTCSANWDSQRTTDLPAQYGLGLAIGGLYVTLEDLVAAYGTLANDGQAFGLNWFEPADKETPAQLIPEDVARQITLFLSDPLARLPTFGRMGPLEYPFPVAVKTGTSQGFRDAWAVAYSSDYIVGAWIGHPDHERMKRVSGLDAAQIVKEIMLSLHPKQRRGVDEAPFPPPRLSSNSGGHADYQLVKLCSLSGEPATGLCAETVLEYLAPGTEPRTACSVHQSFAVDRLTGAQAGPMTPPKRIEVRSYAVLPPQYIAWGGPHGHGLPPTPSNESSSASIAIQEPVNGSVFRFHPEDATRATEHCTQSQRHTQCPRDCLVCRWRNRFRRWATPTQHGGSFEQVPTRCKPGSPTPTSRAGSST